MVMRAEMRHLKKKQMKRQAKVVERLPDTNAIYPPDKQYARATEEMKSPAKKRPLSGGPSPDKHKLEVEEKPDPEWAR